MSATRRDIVVVVSGSSWDGVWSSERQIAERIAAIIPVLWVDQPISVLSPLRSPGAAAALRRPRLRQVRPGITRLTPVVTPGVSRPGLAHVAMAGTRRAIRAAVARLDAHVTGVLVASLADVFGVAPGARKVFYCTDDFSAGAGLMGVSPLLARQAEWRQVRGADTTVVVSDVLAERWRRDGIPAVVIPNGCDAQRLAGTDDAPPATDVDLPAPRAGFVGHISDRIDRAYLCAVADTGASLLLVGPRQPGYDLDQILARPNVRWVGPRPFEVLTSYLRMIDVGLTPYADTPFNRASFPLKTLEYLAAGRAAISTDLPASRWLGTDLVSVAGTAGTFASATVEALAVPATADLVARRRQFAAAHSWDHRAAQIATLLGLDRGTGQDLGQDLGRDVGPPHTTALHPESARRDSVPEGAARP